MTFLDMDSTVAFSGSLTFGTEEPRPIFAIVPKHTEMPAEMVQRFGLPPGHYGWVFVRDLVNGREVTLITDDFLWFGMLQDGMRHRHVATGIDLPVNRFRWRCGGWYDAHNPRYGMSLVEMPTRG